MSTWLRRRGRKNSSFDYFTPSVRVNFEQPRLPFCGVSGRVWPYENEMS